MNIDYTKYEPESDRIKFMVERDGLEGALVFAKQCRRIYRSAILDMRRNDNAIVKRKRIISGRYFRREFISGYLGFKRFVEDFS